MADRIVEFRKANGPFKRIEEIMNVRGMGEKSFLAIKQHLTVGSGAEDPGDKNAGGRPRPPQPPRGR